MADETKDARTKEGEARLLKLRERIDEIDDQIHRLLIERTEVVEGVREVKKDQRVKIRPGREAAILYRLVETHEGKFPKRELIRIWREIIVATLSFEGPFSVAVYTGENGAGYWDIARDHFGSYCPLSGFQSAHQVIDAVSRQDNTVGLLPLISPADQNPWWRHLVSENESTPRVIARLPFAGQGNGISGDVEGLVISPVPPDPSDHGRDRSLIAIDATAPITGERLRGLFRDADMVPGYLAAYVDDPVDSRSGGVWLYMIEVEDFVARDDKRLGHLKDVLGPAAARVVHLGTYATPFAPEELT
ncbi:MAG: chorismate mutase [Magnetovibrionaceae bacterium]